MSAGLPPEDPTPDANCSEESYIRSLEAKMWAQAPENDPEPKEAWPFPHWERYQFQAFIEQGAMGMVFQVFDPLLNRSVALKVLSPKAILHAPRFFIEARTQARVNHPHVVKVHEVGEVDGHPYLTMQLLHGRSLQAIRKELTLSERVTVMRQVCEGVQAAHSKGLLHRDLKPGNIMVERSAKGVLHACVVDFGLACDTLSLINPGNHETHAPLVREDHEDFLCTVPPSDEEITGTPAFMSPEQAAGETMDRRSDVFSLGSTLYATLTGKPPFAGSSLLSMLGKVALSQPEPLAHWNPDIPKDLEAVVNKAMEKDRAKRYISAKALGLDLQRWLDRNPVEALRHKPMYRLGCWIRKYKLLSALGALLTTTTLAVLAWNIHTKQQAEKQTSFYRAFGYEAERIEAAMAFVEILPQHDTLPDRNFLQGKIDEIEKAMKRGGRAARAPGLYGIGRASLALGRWEEARRMLEEAWTLGLETPEMAFVWGKCLSVIYREQLRGLGGALRKEKQAELNQRLRTRILTCLSLAQKCSEENMVDFAEALLAYHSGNAREAQVKSDRLLQKQSWNVHGVLLKARIHLDQAQENPLATNALKAAGNWVAQAKNMARSCVEVYEMEAEVHYQWLFNAIAAQQAFAPHLEQVMTSVRQGRQVYGLSGASASTETQARFLTRQVINE